MNERSPTSRVAISIPLVVGLALLAVALFWRESEAPRVDVPARAATATPASEAPLELTTDAATSVREESAQPDANESSAPLRIIGVVRAGGLHPRLAFAPGVAEEGDRDDLSFASHRTVEVSDDGAFGPTPLPFAPAYQFVAYSDTGWRLTTLPYPDRLPNDGLWHVDFDLEPMTAVRVTVVSLDDVEHELPYRLSIARRPGPNPNVVDVLARRFVHREIMEAVFGDATLAASIDSPLLLAPLPDHDRALRLTLLAPNGEKGGSVDVTLQPQRTVDVVLDARELLGDKRRSRLLAGRVYWSDTELPVGGATVVERSLRLFTTTTETGEFRFAEVPLDRTLKLRLERFDPSNDARLERQSVTLESRAPARQPLQWKVHPYRWLRATGLTIAGAPPVAYSLEVHSLDSGWRQAPADLFESRADGVDVAVKETNTTYRVVAWWSPILRQTTGPVYVESPGSYFDITFDPLDGRRFVDVSVTTSQGIAAPFAHIELNGPLGGPPPITDLTDVHGKVRIGPTNLEEITLLASTDRASGEVSIRPREEGDVTVRLDP